SCSNTRRPHHGGRSGSSWSASRAAREKTPSCCRWTDPSLTFCGPGRTRPRSGLLAPSKAPGRTGEYFTAPAASGSTSLRTEGRWAAPPRVRPRERVEVRRRHTPDWSGDLSTFHRGRKNTHEEWVFLPGSVGWNRNLTFFEGSAPPWMHEPWTCVCEAARPRRCIVSSKHKVTSVR